MVKFKNDVWDSEMAKRWDKYKPPYRPGKERLRMYKYFFRKYSPGKDVLLLGSTPEIRDMLAKEHCKVTLVDKSISMVKAMTILRKLKSNEKIVIKNWMEYKPKEKYDAVFGDNVLNNLPSKDWLRFNKLVASWLNRGGVFINVICGFFRAGYPTYTYEDVVRIYRKNPSYFKNFANRVYFNFSLWWNVCKQNCVDVNKVEEELRKLYLHGRITKKEFNDILIPLNLKLTWFKGKETSQRLKNVFRILVECHEKNHPLHKYFYRFYVLMPKKQK